MKATRRFILTGFLMMVLASCMDHIEFTSDTVVIEYGTICGWCAGEEFITVTGNQIVYTRTIPCGPDEGTTRITRHLPSEKWQAVKESFDYEQFKRLRYDACNVCVDGCDEIIRITKNGETHEIRYTPGTSIPEADALMLQMKDLMDEFTTTD